MVAKQYEQVLVKRLKEDQTIEKINGIDVRVKAIPDGAQAGDMDPRLYASMKKQLRLMRFIPKRFMKIDITPKSLMRMRKMFNGIKSLPVTTAEMSIEQLHVKASDGFQIPVKVYHPLNQVENAPVLYFIHGGGFFAGSSDVIEQLVKMIVEQFEVVAYSVDYRLAPEHPYPIGHNDCYTVLKWIHEHTHLHHGDQDSIFVAGDSAGGNLTQYCTTKDLEDETHMVRGQLLLYPTVNMAGIDDGDMSHWSYDKYEISAKHKAAIMASLGMFKDGAMGMLQGLLGTDDIENIYLTPYNLKRSDLPPTFMTVGEHDFLKVECLAYAAKLIELGNTVETIVYRGLGHAYGDNVGVFPQSEDCAMEMGNFIMKYCKSEEE